LASAIAQVAIGLNLATVVGVPLGTLLGQSAGWRSTFWAVTALGIVGALGVLALVPRGRSLPHRLLVAGSVRLDLLGLGVVRWLILQTEVRAS
jgi:DHA1 family inner membrane transport protein